MGWGVLTESLNLSKSSMIDRLHCYLNSQQRVRFIRVASSLRSSRVELLAIRRSRILLFCYARLRLTRADHLCLRDAEKAIIVQVAVRLNAYMIACAHPCLATLIAWVGSDVHQEAFSCE